MNSIQKAAITGKIQNRLLDLGYRCRTSQSLVLFTDKPLNNKSIKTVTKGVILDEPYMTRFTEKSALKFYESIKAN